MSIGRKLNLTHGLMAVLVLVLLLGTNAVVKTLQRDFAILVEQTLEVTRELESLRAAGLRIVASTAEYLLLSRYESLEGSAARKELELINQGTNLYQSTFDRYSKLVDQFFPNEVSDRDAIGEAGVVLIASSQNLIDLARKNVPTAMLREKKEAFEDLEGSYLTAIELALKHEMAEFDEREEVIRDGITTASTLAWAGFVVVAVAILLVGGFVARGITRPLGKLTEATERIGRGEFGAEVDIHGNDETSVLARAFKQMARDLSSNIVALEGAQKDLKSLNKEQEQRVIELRTEVTERKRAEETLLASEYTLQRRFADLEEAHRKLESQGVDLVRLADDLLFARDEARAADRAKSEFLAAMSHELRTPLNAVIGFSEIIKDETFGPVGSTKYRDYANDINESGQHLLGLINDILDMSKIESGTDDLHEDTIEIPEIIRSVLKLVGQRAEHVAVKLELESADQLPALRADERKLKQILVNLLTNAIKFSDAGGEVALWVWCRRDSGHVFQIIDTGIGIAPEDIPKALSRFGQVDGDLNRQYEGTGLGLPLTKALIEQHGGTLDLQSQVGVGTTVTVRFPAERIVVSQRDADVVNAADRKAG